MFSSDTPSTWRKEPRYHDAYRSTNEFFGLDKNLLPAMGNTAIGSRTIQKLSGHPGYTIQWFTLPPVNHGGIGVKNPFDVWAWNIEVFSVQIGYYWKSVGMLISHNEKVQEKITFFLHLPWYCYSKVRSTLMNSYQWKYMNSFIFRNKTYKFCILPSLRRV